MLPSSTSSVPLCPDHDDQKLGFYCTQCAVPVCDKCSTGRHKGHPVKEVNEQVNQNKNRNTSGYSWTLPEKKKQLEKVMETIDETERKLEDCKNRAYNIHRRVFHETTTAY